MPATTLFLGKYRATSTCDAAGRTAAVVDPLGYRTSYTHDAAGRRTAQITPLGNATTAVYDEAAGPWPSRIRWGIVIP